MNFFKLSLFVLLAMSWSACGEDDMIVPCSQAAWRGTYTGTIDCNGSQEAVTLTITANGPDALQIRYRTALNSTEINDPIMPNECMIDATISSGAMISAELDGNNITFTEEISGTFSSTCVIMATKN